MQGVKDEQDVAERGLQKGNLDLLALKAWGTQMGDLIEAIDDIVKGQDIRAATPGPWLGIGLPEQQLAQLSLHFHKVRWLLDVCLSLNNIAGLCLGRRGGLGGGGEVVTNVWYHVECHGPWRCMSVCSGSSIAQWCYALL